MTVNGTYSLVKLGKTYISSFAMGIEFKRGGGAR